MGRGKSLAKIGMYGVLLLVTTVFFLSPQIAKAASSGKTIELSLGTHPPLRSSPIAGALLPWSKEIEKRTKGRLKIKIYPSQSLIKARDAYEGVVSGIADIGWGVFSFTPGRFPLISVVELPFLSPNTFVGAHVLHDLYKKFPEIRAELKDVHVLDLWVTLPYEIHTVKKPIRTINDIKGMKLATLPGGRAAVEGFGAVPVTMPLPKIYMAVEKGVADGSALAWGAFNTYKLHEVTKYHTNAHLGGLAYWTLMNKNTWNNLPKDIQVIITEVTEEMMPDAISRAVTGEMKKGIKRVKALNHEIIELSPEDLAKWKATGTPAWGKWAKAMEAKGLPGRAVLDEAVKLVERYRKQYMQ